MAFAAIVKTKNDLINKFKKCISPKPANARR